LAKILIIDDNEPNCFLAAAIVERYGAQALQAADAATGIAMALREFPDLILLDLFLPDVDGFEVLRLLKEDEATRAIPVVCLTASTVAAHEMTMRAGGCVGYLTKPYLPADLVMAIERHVPRPAALTAAAAAGSVAALAGPAGLVDPVAADFDSKSPGRKTP
jgi:two-component system cell cycle response regulator DivK